MQTEVLEVWPGERKLLPFGGGGSGGENSYRLRCLSGSGHLRVMNRSDRQVLVSGDEVEIEGQHVATVSGVETMIIELSRIDDEV